MLRQSLKSYAVARRLDLAALLEAAGLDPTRRAEEIDVAGFVKLARAAEKIGSFTDCALKACQTPWRSSARTASSSVIVPASRAFGSAHSSGV